MWIRTKRLRMTIIVVCLLCLVLWFFGTFRRLYLTFKVYQSSSLDSTFIRTPTIGRSRRDLEKNDVILSAYMNSGSRFTGRLLGFHSDSFYFYEPLWKFSIWDYYKPNDVCCSTTSDTCRHVSVDDVNKFQPLQNDEHTEPIVPGIPSYVPPHELFLNIISSVYTCDLVHLKNVVQARVQDSSPYSGPSWEQYRACVTQFNSKSECLRRLSSVCKNRKHRIVKVLRMTLGAFRSLLESNPRLKIIHLVRDPRAIIHSRMFTRHYPVYGYRENDSLERSLCNKMAADFYDGRQLMKDFPSRVKFLYYEDLMDNLRVRLKQVYKFLDMGYDRVKVENLAKVMTNLSPPEKGASFYADRKGNNAQWWRKYMLQQDVSRVDKVCRTVYKSYGYNGISDESHLRNVSISSYKVPYHLQWS